MADLSWENLSEVDLHSMNLSWAQLHGAKLSGADLSGANLSCAQLHEADLRNADLSGAKLSGADLREANLAHADLHAANLSNAVLDEKTVLDEVRYDNTTGFFKPCCPEEGSFVAYKKAFMYSKDLDKGIVKLQVPANARRSSATSRKCRVSEAKVVSITSLDGKKSFKKARSFYEETFVYEVGKTVKVKNFDPCRWKECAAGIHCFLTRDEAVDY